MLPPAKTVFLDRDGTIIVECDYLSDPDLVLLEEGAGEALRRFANAGYRLVVVSNQSGIGRGYFGETELKKVNDRLAELLLAQDVAISAWYHCPHAPEETCDCRKPLPGMLDQANADVPVLWSESFLVGDKPCDVLAAKVRGMRGFLVGTDYGARAGEWAGENGVKSFKTLSELADFVL